MPNLSIDIPNDKYATALRLLADLLEPDQDPTELREWAIDMEADDFKAAKDETVQAAMEILNRLSDQASALFDELMDNPDTKYTGTQLADKHQVINGAAGVAGAFGWPGRYCHEAGYALAVKTDKKNGLYWMDADTAEVFDVARTINQMLAS
jgi:hypothetical protein